MHGINEEKRVQKVFHHLLRTSRNNSERKKS